MLVALVTLAARGGAHRVTAPDPPATKIKTVKDSSSKNSPSAARRSVRARTPVYSDPLAAVRGLAPGRIDMGVDYVGAGSISALGNGRVTMASNHDSGPPSCWGRTCWPAGGIVVYRLSDGTFAGRYIYVAENITAEVKKGQAVKSGEPIAVAHDASPHLETGWASGKGAETLAIADRHQCPWGDPGGWSTIEGRNFNHLLTALGAPSGYVQPNLPKQTMPSTWPRWSPPSGATSAAPRSQAPLSEGSTARLTKSPRRGEELMRSKNR